MKHFTGKLLKSTAIAGMIITSTAISNGQSVSAIMENLQNPRHLQFPYTVGFTPGEEMKLQRQIAPGVSHRFESLPELPLTMNMVSIDLAREDLVLEARNAGTILSDAMTVPSLVEKLHDPAKRPIAAINGDFWGSGRIPINAFVTKQGIWKTYPSRRNQQLKDYHHIAWTDEGEITFGSERIRIFLSNGEESFEIDDFNFRYDDTESLLYNHLIGELPSLPDDEWQILLRVETFPLLPNRETTVTASPPPTSTSTLAENELLLTSTGDRPQWLQPGEQYQLEAEYRGVNGAITGLVGAGGLLIQEGENITETITEREGISITFSDTRHPRTAVGLMPDMKTIVFVTVDGRQPELSRGISLPELSLLMEEMGCYYAINMDGGGSTTMVVEGDVVNFPSDVTGPRAVSNALVVSRTAPLSEPARLELSPAGGKAPVGSSVTVYPSVYTEDGEELARSSWSENFTITQKSPDGRTTTIEGASTTTLPFFNEGMHSLTATLSRENAPNLKAEHQFEAVEPASVSISPEVLTLRNDEETVLNLTVSGKNGEVLTLPFEPLTVEVPDFLDWDPITGSIKALDRGSGEVKVRLRDTSATAKVSVDMFEYDVIMSFDELTFPDDGEWMGLTQADESKTSIILNEDGDYIKEGTGSWRFNYGLTKGATSKISLPLDLEIPAEAQGIGVWIYGDGKGQWFRGTLIDGNGTKYYLNFTSSDGVTWINGWEFCKALLRDLPVAGTAKGPMTPPYKLTELYLVQPKEEKKTAGTIYFDGFTALLPPE